MNTDKPHKPKKFRSDTVQEKSTAFPPKMQISPAPPTLKRFCWTTNSVLLHPPGHPVNSNVISYMSQKWVCHQMIELNHIFVYQDLGSDPVPSKSTLTDLDVTGTGTSPPVLMGSLQKPGGFASLQVHFPLQNVNSPWYWREYNSLIWLMFY